MHQQITLDSSGDSRHVFDPEDAANVAVAKRRFERLVSRGFYAFDKNAGRRLGGFDPSVEETVFVPRLKGG